MSRLKKISLGFSILAAILLLSGCGVKNSDNKSAEKTQKLQAESESYAQELTKPTGVPDDAAKAALEEILAEEKDIADEEQTAAIFLDDSAETDNFANAYDENEF